MNKEELMQMAQSAVNQITKKYFYPNVRLKTKRHLFAGLDELNLPRLKSRES